MAWWSNGWDASGSWNANKGRGKAWDDWSRGWGKGGAVSKGTGKNYSNGWSSSYGAPWYGEQGYSNQGKSYGWQTYGKGADWYDTKGSGKNKAKGKDKGKGKSNKGKGKSKGKGDSKGKGNNRKKNDANRRTSVFMVQSMNDHAGTKDILKAVGGHIVELHTSSPIFGTAECILIEPAGRRLQPDKFLTTGVVICMDGLPLICDTSEDRLREWCEATKLTRWLELGVVVALLNVQMSSALQLTDLEAVVHAAYEASGGGRCMLVGKGWGAHRSVELAASETNKYIDSVILVSPGAPAPAQCHNLSKPALLLWARDDEMTPFEEKNCWIDALDGRCAPTVFNGPNKGGHSFNKMMEEEGVSDAIQKFTASSLLIANLAEEEALLRERSASKSKQSPGSPSGGDGDGEEGDDAEMAVTQQRSERLAAELPATVQRQDSRKLAEDLPHWIQGGMVASSE